jgi:hypothetical protein
MTVPAGLRFRLDRLRSRPNEALVWACVPLTAAIVWYQPRYFPAIDLRQLVAAVLALALIVAAARRPDRAIAAFVIVMPFQLFAQSWLFSKGVPSAILRNAGYWKEAVALGLFAAGWRGYVARGRRADALDVLGLVYVGFVAMYAAVPLLFASEAPTDALIRYTGFREMAGYVLLLLACRHAQFPPGTLSRLVKVVIGVAAVTSAIAIYEAMFSDTWNDFVVNTMEVPRWLYTVGTPPQNLTDLRIYAEIGGRQVTRVASVFVSLFFPQLLLLPIALLFGQFVGRKAAGRLVGVAALIVTALLLTQTRNTIGAAGLIVFLTFWIPARGSAVEAAKARLALAVAAGLILLAPFAVSSGLVGRIQAIVTNEDQSQQAHQSGIDRGWNQLVDTPLGLGLGTTQGAGQRFGTVVVGADNQYLHVGDEVGVIGMVLYTALVVVMVPKRLKGSRDRPATLEMTAVRYTIIAIAVASWLHQPWIDLSITWTFWCLAGVALSDGESRSEVEAPAAREKEPVRRSTVAATPMPSRARPHPR